MQCIIYQIAKFNCYIHYVLKAKESIFYSMTAEVILTMTIFVAVIN